MPVRARPLSPHVWIYRWQIGNTLSILHRFTGIFLALGFVALSYWLVALAGDSSAYATAARLFASPLGWFALLAWTFAFFYHLLNGIRHLFWDAGYGFEQGARRASAWFAVGGAFALTLAVWGLLWQFGRL